MNINEADIQLFNDSFTRCLSDARFRERFYELFLASSEEVRHKFRNTDIQKQHRILRASLYIMMLSADGQPEGLVQLERIAALHSRRDRDIPPHLYDLWLDCLVQAARELDRHFTPETERLWRRMMETGIAFMKSRYDSS